MARNSPEGKRIKGMQLLQSLGGLAGSGKFYFEGERVLEECLVGK